MSEYSAQVLWERGADAQGRRYSRAHNWLFDGGISVPASASPHIVPLPYSSAEAVDPEEALVAALSSCHMLFFLQYAHDCGHTVLRYEDNAVGEMGKREDGRVAMTRVSLSPQVSYAPGDGPNPADEQALHERAHHSCFIANSVKTEVVTELSE